jgi:small subunit ribosomal protein S6
MMRNYETVFILTPVLSDAQVKETVNKYKKVLTDSGAKILFEENWGLKKLAYPIQKKSTGFYHLFEYKVEGSKIREIEIAMKRDEKLLRFLTVSLDKHAIAYNEKKRAMKKAAAKEKAEA